MKKIVGIILTVIFVAGISMTGYAAKAEGKKSTEKYERIVAQVVSLDTAADTMVVTVEKTGESKTIKISAKAASQLKAGDRVRIKLKPGTDVSAGVRVLRVEPKVETPAAPAPAPEPVKK